MAKEPEPRSVGDLSAYVSERFNDISRQNTEAEAQARTAKDREIELFLQGTALLRAHLQDLVAPIEEVLTRFQIRQLLEEAADILNSHKNPHKNSSNDYQVRDLRPRLYRQVVTNPKPTDSYFRVGADLRTESEKEIGNSWKPKPVFRLAHLTDPDNFKKLIPTFNASLEPYDSYGLALVTSGEWPLLVRPPQDVIWAGRNRTRIGWSPGAGDIYREEPGFQVALSDQRPSHYVNIKVTKSLSITGIDTAETPALWYSHRLERVDLRGTSCDYNQSLGTSLTQQRVHPDDPGEVLRNLIGNDVARELAGEFKGLLHQYAHEQR